MIRSYTRFSSGTFGSPIVSRSMTSSVRPDTLRASAWRTLRIWIVGLCSRSSRSFRSSRPALRRLSRRCMKISPSNHRARDWPTRKPRPTPFYSFQILFEDYRSVLTNTSGREQNHSSSLTP